MSAHVSREEWERLAEQDQARRADAKDYDFGSSILTGVSALLMIMVVVVGPMWTLIEVVGGPDEHSSSFDSYWWASTVLILLAAAPLGLAIRRERSRARWWLAGMLAVSLVIQLATYPW